MDLSATYSSIATMLNVAEMLNWNLHLSPFIAMLIACCTTVFYLGSWYFSCTYMFCILCRTKENVYEVVIFLFFVFSVHLSLLRFQV